MPLIFVSIVCIWFCQNPSVIEQNVKSRKIDVFNSIVNSLSCFFFFFGFWLRKYMVNLVVLNGQWLTPLYIEIFFSLFLYFFKIELSASRWSFMVWCISFLGNKLSSVFSSSSLLLFFNILLLSNLIVLSLFHILTPFSFQERHVTKFFDSFS